MSKPVLILAVGTDVLVPNAVQGIAMGVVPLVGGGVAAAREEDRGCSEQTNRDIFGRFDVSDEKFEPIVPIDTRSSTRITKSRWQAGVPPARPYKNPA